MVAIPVKNEAERIGACLAALSAQQGVNRGSVAPFGVLLFVNNSDDDTADVAHSLVGTLTFPLTILRAVLPPGEASAGGARRHAMDAASRLLGDRDGVLMTTDADSRVPPDWIAKTLAALDRGVDAVAGTVALEPQDEAALPQALKVRGALEATYEALVCEIETRLNPQAHDPWPRHPTESGASFALTLTSFRAVGGVPDKALGEDRALAAALRREGFRIRHAPDLIVLTSGRLFGRAEGGCADTMRRRIEEPSALCDDYLRPAWDVVRDAVLSGPRSTRTLGPADLPHQIRIARAITTALRGAQAVGQFCRLACQPLAKRWSQGFFEEDRSHRAPRKVETRGTP